MLWNFSIIISMIIDFYSMVWTSYSLLEYSFHFYSHPEPPSCFAPPAPLCSYFACSEPQQTAKSFRSTHWATWVNPSSKLQIFFYFCRISKMNFYSSLNFTMASHHLVSLSCCSRDMSVPSDWMSTDRPSSCHGSSSSGWLWWRLGLWGSWMTCLLGWLGH